MNYIVRQDIEKTIKEFSLNRNRIFEVSKQDYKQILKKIEQTFVLYGQTIHWANMGYYNQNFPVWTVDCRDNPFWFEKLNKIIPNPQNAVYVLFEEMGRQRPKYWVFEMYLEELIIILNESIVNDYYIISKKYDWLISENHHRIVSFVGKSFHLSPMKI